MTDEELTAIEEVILRAQQSSGMAAGHDVVMIHAPALLAEARSLRAERDALRAVYDAAMKYCRDNTVMHEHALIDAVGDVAVQP